MAMLNSTKQKSIHWDIHPLLSATNSLPFRNRPPLSCSNGSHASNRIHDCGMPDRLQNLHISRAVSIRETRTQVQGQLCGELLNQTALSCTVWQWRNELSSVESFVLFRHGSDAAIDTESICDRLNEKIQRTCYQDYQVPGLPVFLHPPQALSGYDGTQHLTTKFLPKWFDHLRRFARKVEFALTKRLQGHWRHMTEQPPSARAQFRPTNDLATPERTEKADLAGFSGQQRVVYIEEGGDLGFGSQRS